MGKRTATLTQEIECPRWAGFPAFLRRLCLVHDASVEMEIDKGWIRETVAYRIKGPIAKIVTIQQEIEQSAREYNAR